MKLFKFPEVVLIEIFKAMSLGELFLLSFASKRTRELIKYLYPKNHAKIAVELDHDEYVLKTRNRKEIVCVTEIPMVLCVERLEMLNSGKLHVLVESGHIVRVYSDAADFLLKIHKYLSDLLNFTAPASVTMLDTAFLGRAMLPSIYDGTYNKKRLEELIRKNIRKDVSDVMRNEQRNLFRCRYSRYPRDEQEFQNFLESRDKIGKLYRGYPKSMLALVVDDSLGKSHFETGFVRRDCDRDDLSYFFRAFPELKFCLVESHKSPNGFLSSSPSMNQVDDLILRHVDIAFTLLLISYQGRNCLLQKCQLRLEFPNLFDRLLVMWKTGKREKLRSFIAYQNPELGFNPEPYLGVFGDEKWDPEKRPRYYPYESIITNYHNFPPETFDCKDGVDIVRESDGRRATVKMTTEHFMFFVWPESESRAEN